MTKLGFFLLHWFIRAAVVAIGFFIFIILTYLASWKEFPPSESEWQFYIIISIILGFAVSFSIAVSDCFAKTDLQKVMTILLLSLAVGAAGGIVLDGFETGFNDMKQNAIAGGIANLVFAFLYILMRYVFSSNKSRKQSGG